MLPIVLIVMGLSINILLSMSVFGWLKSPKISSLDLEGNPLQPRI